MLRLLALVALLVLAAPAFAEEGTATAPPATTDKAATTTDPRKSPPTPWRCFARS